MAATPPVADPASSVIVLRPAAGRFETLMVRRRPVGFFGDLVVFPGGGVDDLDRSTLARETVACEADDHDHRSAALRELAEETGLIVGGEGAESGRGLKGRALFADLKARGVSLRGDDLTPVSRWVTPEAAPRRFDTRFYLLAVDDPPPVAVDEDELVGFEWVAPERALSRHADGEWPMVLPTVAHLRWLSRQESIAEAVASARGGDGPPGRPELVRDGGLIPTPTPGGRP